MTDRVKLFFEMVRCIYPIHFWEYDADLSLQTADSQAEQFGSDIIRLLSISDVLKQQLLSQKRCPFLLETGYGVLFLCEVSYEGSTPEGLYLFGGLYTGSTSNLMIQQRLANAPIMGRLRQEVLTAMQQLPIIPTSTLLQYAVMLHYALTGETISTADILSVSSMDESAFPDPASSSHFQDTRGTDSHFGVWESEKALLRMIREGNRDYRKALSRSMSLSSGVRADTGDPVRHSKNNSLTLLTLVVRAAIEGGLSPEIAYSLNDHYAAMIEHARSISAVTMLSGQLLDDFIERVHDVRDRSGTSSSIQNACHYIDTHLSEPLTIHDLASQAGYADYYFSQKFKNETGQTVSEYLCDKRIEKAMELLRDPAIDLSDVQEMVGFQSRSRFYDLFKQKTGLSPAQYRARPVLF
ncbi:MAG: helix-turn-helix domain-containing protein [Firmicutes bacterium]|nr:helix-turn-helix domain-containing protein [Bacillota bacterium]